MSVMGDMQALVMELKNLVEQCLASERAVQVRVAVGVGVGVGKTWSKTVDFGVIQNSLKSLLLIQDSGALTLSPVMSAVLGLSHSGGVTR